MRFSFLASSILTLGLFASQASAHHSSAMFDRDKQFTVEGTVKDFQWTNPHSWLIVEVVENGASKEYSLEGQSPNILIRKGWKPDSLKSGDKVTIVGHPLKDGTPGGQLVSVTTADGSVFGTAY